MAAEDTADRDDLARSPGFTGTTDTPEPSALLGPTESPAGRASQDPGSDTISRQARNRLRTRKRILDAAIELISRQGYEHTTIQDIADSADIALRTFYYHFDSKADLAMAWFNDWAEDLAAAIDAQPSDASPADLLTGALAAMTAKGYPGAVTWSDAEGRPTLPAPAWALFEESDPAVLGLVYRRLVAGYVRLSGIFRARLGYGEDAWEPYVIASSVVALWFVAMHGSRDAIDRGREPPSLHATVQRAFLAYADGLEHLWTERPSRR